MLNKFKNYKYRKPIIGGLLSGFGFASLMAIFNYTDRKDFNVLKFIFHAVFFCLFMSFMFFNRNNNENSTND